MILLGFVYRNDEIEWKKIYWENGEETKYSVANVGLVKNDKNNKILKTNFYKGYERIKLTHKGKSKQYFIHRLVATAFIPNPENKPEVNHKDGKKNHNYDKNLEWDTRPDNMKHAFSTGLAKANSNTKTFYHKDQIIAVCKLLESGTTKSFTGIGEECGVDRRAVSDIYKRKLYKNISSDYDFSKYSIKTDFSKKGDDNENTKYSDKVIHKICQLIDSGCYTLQEIAKKTDVPYQTIRNVYYGSCRKSISSQYDFSKSKKNPLFEDKKKEVIKACELLDKGYNTKEVSERVNLSRSVIRNIYSGNNWTEVSKNYNFYKNRDQRKRNSDN